jgi:hypothetical protein
MVVGIYRVSSWVLIMNLLQKFIGVVSLVCLRKTNDLDISFFLLKELLLGFMIPWSCAILPLGFLDRET